MQAERISERARVHAALADPHRLAIVDQLVSSDRAPTELAASLGIDSNLLAHHLRVLEELSMIERVASQGDRRRRYVRLVPAALADLGVGGVLYAGRVVFICTENVARSQLAAAIWNHLNRDTPATSGGTSAGSRVHPAAMRTATRRGLDLRHARPGPIPEIGRDDLVITVCDRARESLRFVDTTNHLHWSVPDPVASNDPRAFDTAADILEDRIHKLAPHIRRLEPTSSPEPAFR